MADKPPKKDTRFKPGVSGNPSGRPKLPADIVEARRLNQVELERVMNRLLYVGESDLVALLENPETVMLERMVGSIILAGAVKGDQQRLEFILQRMIGRVTDKIEVQTKPYVIKHLDGTQTVLGAKSEEEAG